MKTKTKDVVIQEATVKTLGKKVMVQGHDGNGNKMAKFVSLQTANDAVAAGTAKWVE